MAWSWRGSVSRLMGDLSGHFQGQAGPSDPLGCVHPVASPESCLRSQPKGPAGHPTLTLGLHGKSWRGRGMPTSFWLLCQFWLENMGTLVTNYYRFVFNVKKLWPWQFHKKDIVWYKITTFTFFSLPLLYSALTRLPRNFPHCGWQETMISSPSIL